MRSSMRTITNVSLDGRAVDLTVERSFSFVNNCDSLSFMSMDIQDMDDGDSFSFVWGDGISKNTPWSDKKRGDTVTLSTHLVDSDLYISDYLTPGHDYLCTMVIWQSKLNASEEDPSPGQYDVYMGAGHIQQSSDVPTEIYIDKDIGFIKSPKRRYDERLIGGCILRLSDRDLLIEDYSPSTGLAEVSAIDPINGKSYTTRATHQGETYKLITNYLWCDAFCFYYRTEPQLELSYKITNNGINVTGEYSQAEGVAFQSYRMWAKYDAVSALGITSGPTIEHETKFRSVISDSFPLLKNATIYCELTTQDGFTKQFSVRVNTETELAVEPRVTVSDSGMPTELRVSDMPDFRYLFVWALQEGESTLRYLGNDYTQGIFGNLKYYIGNGQKYRYYAVVVNSEGKIGIGTPQHEVGGELTYYYGDTSRAWTICHLTPTGNHQYKVDKPNEEYEFTVDVQPSAIETITGSTAYGSEGRYPKYVHGTAGYDTGTFTALLGSVTDPEASPVAIKDWCDFISQEGYFLMKTDSGDVKIVAITGDPLRQYGTALAEIGLTRVTYTWVEIDSIEGARVYR